MDVKYFSTFCTLCFMPSFMPSILTREWSEKDEKSAIFGGQKYYKPQSGGYEFSKKPLNSQYITYPGVARAA